MSTPAGPSSPRSGALARIHLLVDGVAGAVTRER
jgi:hypothetical protein